jgi:perosamine synthetase
MTKINSSTNSKLNIPFFLPKMTKDDVKAVVDSLKSPLLTDGPKLELFEKNFANFTGAKYAVGVSNATSALHLALKSIGIGKNDEVIIPNLTFVSTANAVILCGGTPVLADVLPIDLNLSPDSIKKNLSKKTKAIIPVHFAGKSCDMKLIKNIAKKNNLFIIEDSAHAIGTKLENKHAGTWSDAGCFSFYPTKNLTTIEGGMIVTNNKKIFEKVKSLRNNGLTRNLSQRYSSGHPWDYDIFEPGYNYRLDEVRSSLGLNQLKKLKTLNKLRKQSSDYYDSKLEKINGLGFLTKIKNSDDSHHLYIIKILKEYGISRDDLFKNLKNMGIQTTVHYKPLNYFNGLKKYVKSYGSLKNSEKLYNEIISLPFYPYMPKKDQDIIISSIKNLASKEKI